jgi:hypothetical protein
MVEVAQQKVVEVVSVLNMGGMTIAGEDLEAYPRYQFFSLDGFS